MDEETLTLSEYELKAIAESPEALTALIDYHDHQGTMGEAMGYDVSFHDKRVEELTALRTAAETARAERQR